MTLMKTPLRRTALVTAGPTVEPIDPVRYISNHSTGEQGYDIAARLAKKGFDVVLVSGPTALPAPKRVRLVRVTTAEEMLAATLSYLPADVFVGVAAVADYRVDTPATHKIKKSDAIKALSLLLIPNPDILKSVATHPQRPALVVGFALESESLEHNARAKQRDKNVDFMVANMAGDLPLPHKSALFLRRDTPEVEEWVNVSKKKLAEKLVDRIENFFHNSTRSLKS